MSARMRALTLPLLAVVVSLGVLGAQWGNGGGDFTPARAASPCAVRPVTSVASGVENLGERLVLIGLDGAACRLGVTREALVLRLAEQRSPTAAQVTAVRAGLLGAVARLKADGTLPKASALTDEVVDGSGLPGFVKTIVKALPASLIDDNLATDDVLRRAVAGLDVRAVLSELDDPDALQRQVTSAVTRAVKDALLARLKSLI